ncbi:hypothetical protein NDU88_004377 [Pleurodeles waltl]|uniref:Uncharacterized protein n=1 Tax=Pleurodeles waltl TaxID=8319 RepID=A0AAV7MUZ1_PLEWA|nr:hypothetical protein NDU88_004377 [Pleurodeles waltl]
MLAEQCEETDEEAKDLLTWTRELRENLHIVWEEGHSTLRESQNIQKQWIPTNQGGVARSWREIGSTKRLASDIQVKEASEERDGGADADVLERTREPFGPIVDERTGETREPFVPVGDGRTREIREPFVPIRDRRTGETREPFVPIGDGRTGESREPFIPIGDGRI